MSLVFLIIHSVLSLIYLIPLTIIIPRISKHSNRTPFKYFLSFYIISTLMLFYVNGMNSSNTIVTNLLLLAFGHMIGLKLRLLGLTGQICSGKSLAAEYLRDHYSASVIESEQLEHDIIGRTHIKREVIKLIGERILSDDHSRIDRNKMKEVLMNEPKLAHDFQLIIHGPLYLYLLKTILYEKLIRRKRFVFLEHELLFTFPILTIICFPILAICSDDKEMVLRRIQDKYHVDRNVANNYSKSQFSIEVFKQKSDKVIINDGEIQVFYAHIDRFMADLII